MVDAVKAVISQQALIEEKQAAFNSAQAALDNAIDAGIKVEINEIELAYDNTTASKKNLSIKKYFAKVQPKLSLKSNNNDELVVEIANPSDSAKSFTIV